MKAVQMEDGTMTSRQHAFLAILHRAVLSAGLIAMAVAIGSKPADQSLLAAEVVIEAPAPAPPAESRPAEETTPKRGDQPKERKRTQDGPPRDELLPNGRRLPA
jgi:hypothetical protein